MKRFALLLALLLLPAEALAVTAVNRYVTTDCANNGDGTAASCAAISSAPTAMIRRRCMTSSSNPA